MAADGAEPTPCRHRTVNCRSRLGKGRSKPSISPPLCCWQQAGAWRCSWSGPAALASDPDTRARWLMRRDQHVSRSPHGRLPGSQCGSHPGERLPPAGERIGTGAWRSPQPTDPTCIYGSEGWGFESLRARPGQRPYEPRAPVWAYRSPGPWPSPQGAPLPSHAVTGGLVPGPAGLG